MSGVVYKFRILYIFVVVFCSFLAISYLFFSRVDDDLSPAYGFDIPLKVEGSSPHLAVVAGMPFNGFVSFEISTSFDVSVMVIVSRESMSVSSKDSAPGSFPIFSDKISGYGGHTAGRALIPYAVGRAVMVGGAVLGVVFSPSAFTAAKWITGVVNATPHDPARRAGEQSFGMVFLGNGEREGALGNHPVAVVGAPVDGTAATASVVS